MFFHAQDSQVCYIAARSKMFLDLDIIIFLDLSNHRLIRLKLQINCIINFFLIFFLYLMFYVCVTRFDVTRNLNFLKKFRYTWSKN